MTDPMPDPQDNRALMLALVKQMYELTDVVHQMAGGAQAALRRPRLKQIKADLHDIGRQLDG